MSQQTRPPFPGHLSALKLLLAPSSLLIRPDVEEVVRPNAVCVSYLRVRAKANETHVIITKVWTIVRT